jgi:hypothetical protein
MASATDSNEAPRRDRLAERVLLDHSQRTARLSVASWPQRVEQRLAAGQELYGDSALSRPLDELLEEIAEEALDTAGWSCLASHVLMGSELDADTTATIGEMLGQAMAAGATAHAHITAARTALRRAGK